MKINYYFYRTDSIRIKKLDFPKKMLTIWGYYKMKKKGKYARLQMNENFQFYEINLDRSNFETWLEK